MLHFLLFTNTNTKSILDSMSQIIELNVRGSTLFTTRATLCQQPGSKLAEIANFGLEHSLLSFEGKIFIDRDPVVFSQLLNALTEGMRVPWSKSLEGEAEFWGIELDRERCQPQYHYLTVRTGAPFVTPGVLLPNGSNVRDILTGVEFLPYSQILAQYAEKFNYRITNIWPADNEILVEMCLIF